MVSVEQIAKKLKMNVEAVRGILFESSQVDRKTKDRVFNTARKMGYDTTRLNISKKMVVRKKTMEEIIAYVEANPKWGRNEILSFLKKNIGLVARVHKKVVPEAYKCPACGKPRVK